MATLVTASERTHIPDLTKAMDKARDQGMALISESVVSFNFDRSFIVFEDDDVLIDCQLLDVGISEDHPVFRTSLTPSRELDATRRGQEYGFATYAMARIMTATERPQWAMFRDSVY